MDTLLTTTQVADMAGVHINTVRRWCRMNQIAHTRVGKTIRIPQSALTPTPAVAPDVSIPNPYHRAPATVVPLLR